jgi:hypothetical protein
MTRAFSRRSEVAEHWRVQTPHARSSAGCFGADLLAKSRVAEVWPLLAVRCGPIFKAFQLGKFLRSQRRFSRVRAAMTLLEVMF